MTTCYSSFVAETRSSHSLTATLSDFATGSINTCSTDLAVTKTDGVTSVVPGGSTTYTITVSNAGPDADNGAKLSDPLPAGVTGGNWTFVSPTGGGSVTGPTSGTGALATTVNLPVNASVTFTFTVQIDPTATGTLTNTATVSPPPGEFDPNPANNTATDTDTLTPVADLAITKTDGKTSAVPGGSTTYTIVVSNAGPSAVTGASVADPLPAGVTSATWTATASSGGGKVTGRSSGSGALATTVDLPVNASVTFTFTVLVDPSAAGTLANTATVTPPAGVTDPNPANNTATDTDTLTPQADLAITKTDGKTSVVPGTLDTYTIVVSNAGPSAVTGASVSDPLPAGVTSATWTATDSSGGGSVTGQSSGSGALATTVNLPVNASVTFTFTVQVDPSATGTLANTATVSPPAGVTDPNGDNNSATDSDSLTPQADLAITKDDGVTSAVPGTSTTYRIVVSNAGPSTAVDQAVTDLFPAAITAVSWTAVASPGSSVAAASGSGNIATTVTLLPGGTVTFTAVAQISSSAPREVGSLVNTATVAVPPGDNTPGDNSATDSDSLTPQTGLAITKTDGKTTAVPGTSTTYTITVSNAGPSAATGASVSDPLPAGVTGGSWTATASSGGGVITGPSSGTGALATTINLPVNATVTFSFTATIDPTATGSLVNIATVTPPGGTPTAATDTDALTPRADLAITKDDGKASAVPGTPDTYTITVTNAGPSTVSSVILTDAVPAGLLNPVFGTPSAGSYDPATGVWSGLSLAAGQSVTITLTGTIDPTATGTLTNTAHVAPPPGVTDPNPANNNDSDTDTLTPQADLAITKTDGKASAVPGTPDTYTITVSNAGPSTVSSVILTDDVPAALLNPVFGTPSAGSYDPATGVWSGLSLASGQSVTITLTGTIDPAATGTLTNTATVSPPAGVTDPTPANNSATDTDTLTPQADLAITKTDGVTSVVPGTSNTYTIVVSNAGPSAVTGVSVSDPVPAGVTAATWTATDSSGFGKVTGPSSGSGALATTVDLPVNATVTFTFTVQVDPSATGTLTNTATVSPPPGVTDPNPANNSATDSDNLTPQADLAITKDDGALSAVPGTSTTYRIVVSNAGPSTAVDQTVTDLFPAAITAVSWTAVASPGSSVAAASGTGDILTTVTLLPGGTVTFTAVATISPSATGTLTNTATVAVPPGDNTPGDNSATDTDSLTPLAGLAITKDRRPDHGGAGPQHHLHHHRQQRRPQRRYRGKCVRPAAGRRHRRHLGVHRRDGRRRGHRAVQRHRGPGHHHQPTRQRHRHLQHSRPPSTRRPPAAWSTPPRSRRRGARRPRHRHQRADVPGRPGRHQGRRQGQRRAGHARHLHHHRQQQRPEHGQQRHPDRRRAGGAAQPRLRHAQRRQLRPGHGGLERAEPGVGPVGHHHADGHHRSGGHRCPDQHGARGPARRGDRPQPGQQQRQRHRHPDAPGRPGHHQGRWGHVGGAGHVGHVHDRGQQPRAQRRDRGQRVRLPAGRRQRR